MEYLADQLLREGHVVRVFHLSRYVEEYPKALALLRLVENAFKATHIRVLEIIGEFLTRLGEGQLAAMSTLRDDLVAFAPDLVHHHDFLRTVRLASKVRQLRIAQVWTNHLGEFLKLRRIPFGRHLLRLLTKSFDFAMGPSRELSDQSAVSAPICYVPNGVDSQAFAMSTSQQKPRLRRQLPIDNDAPLIVIPRRWAPNKGVLEAAEAASILGVRATVAFLGSGAAEDYPVYAARIRAALDGVEGLHIVPSVDHAEMAVWLRAADVVLVPSHLEATSLSALEAMASGAIVVASRTGGLSDLLEHGVTGILLERPVADDIAQAVRDVLSLSLEQSDAMRLRARQLVVNRYSWQAVTRSALAVYEQAVRSRESPPTRPDLPRPDSIRLRSIGKRVGR